MARRPASFRGRDEEHGVLWRGIQAAQGHVCTHLDPYQDLFKKVFLEGRLPKRPPAVMTVDSAVLDALGPE